MVYDNLRKGITQTSIRLCKLIHIATNTNIETIKGTIDGLHATHATSTILSYPTDMFVIRSSTSGQQTTTSNKILALRRQTFNEHCNI